MPPHYAKNPLYTPEFKASLRRAYEETHEPMWSIAQRHGIGENTLQHMVKREGWCMRTARMRELIPAQFLLEEAQAILAASAMRAKAEPEVSRVTRKLGKRRTRKGQEDRDKPEAATRGDGSPPGRPRRPPSPLQGEGEVGPASPTSASSSVASSSASPILSAIQRIEKLLLNEIAFEEERRAKFADIPRSTAEAARTARNLATLTQTMHALRQLKLAETIVPSEQAIQTGKIPNHDDLPDDIDEFRRALASRIEAWAASGGAADAGGSRTAALVEEA